MNDENQLTDENDMQLWERYVEAYEIQQRRRQEMRDKASDFVALIRYGLSR